MPGQSELTALTHLANQGLNVVDIADGDGRESVLSLFTMKPAFLAKKRMSSSSATRVNPCPSISLQRQ